VVSDVARGATVFLVLAAVMVLAVKPDANPTETTAMIENESPGAMTWAEAPPAGLEPATLRLTVECSAN
jgi:hypothetical protein